MQDNALKPLNTNNNKEVKTPVAIKTFYKQEKIISAPLYHVTPVKGVENLKTSPADHIFSPNSNFLEPRKPAVIRKPLKRIRSPTLESDCSPGN